VNESRVGVLLLNFGGPETLDDVKPFLYHLFADPGVLQLPFIVREPLARLIATVRHKRSRGYYEKIGGGSPIRKITEQQGQALKTALEQQGHRVRIYIGMQCWHPFIKEAVGQIISDRLTHLVVFPLFPQFSVTTTGACLIKFDQQVKTRADWPVTKQEIIQQWHDHPLYIQSLAELIRDELKTFSPDAVTKVHLLFSAHSIPQKYVDRGDPYEEQTRRTVELIMDQLGWRNPYHLAFQSRLGPVQWLQPYTDRMIQQLGREGVDHVLAIPISFVSEHIETLYEIDLLYKEMARDAGISDFRRAPAPNIHPVFVQALAGLVQERLARFNLEPVS
jgi:ferrochelatase